MLVRTAYPYLAIFQKTQLLPPPATTTISSLHRFGVAVSSCEMVPALVHINIYLRS